MDIIGLRRKIKTMYYSVVFNFKVLPLKMALKFPFYVYEKPVVLSNSGKIIINPPIRKGMIRIGRQRTPIRMPESIIWRNRGTIVFKGCCRMGHGMLIQTNTDGFLEFGDQTAFNCGCKIVCDKSIIFDYKARISWDCQFYDTDFHPIVDTIRNKPLKLTIPITIGDNVWIGHNVIVSKGVKLASYTIVSSGSVVKNKFTSPNCIIAGNPARTIDEGYKPVFDDLVF